MREFCAQKGIVITAYSPLGAKGTAWGTNRVMDNEVLREIANAKGKTVAQVCVYVLARFYGKISEKVNSSLESRFRTMHLKLNPTLFNHCGPKLEDYSIINLSVNEDLSAMGARARCELPYEEL